MARHEFTGKTTEEAISEGLRVLGLTISDVKVEVAEEGAKGLLGLFGSRSAKVYLTTRDGDDDALSLLGSLSLDDYTARNEAAEKAPQQRPQPAQKPQQPAPKPARADKPVERRERTEHKKPHHDKPERPQRPHVERPRSEGPAFQPIPLVEGAEPPVHDAATPAGRAQQFLLELTRLMNVPVVVDVQADPEGNLFVQMLGDTLGILIGRRGETLDALQYLTSLQVNKNQPDYLRVTLDTENYRAKREDSLQRLAARMATRAVKTGRKVALEPMNPYERRILHSALQNHPQVTTHSEGEDPNRHVVITVKKD